MKHILLALVLTSLVFSQNVKQTEATNYKTQLSELKKRKAELLEKRKELKKEIGELTKEQIKLSDPNLRREICREYFLKKYGKKIGNRILNGQVWKGMTEEMLRDSYGEPDNVNVNKQKWGVYSQWYYGKQIFFFKNGKLFDWEQ